MKHFTVVILDGKDYVVEHYVTNERQKVVDAINIERSGTAYTLISISETATDVRILL